MGDHRAVTGDELGESATHDARETLDLIEQLKRAVDSIPSYIERCAEMFILVPSVKHADRAGDVCDFNTWRQRGWCRMEVGIRPSKWASNTWRPCPHGVPAPLHSADATRFDPHIGSL